MKIMTCSFLLFLLIILLIAGCTPVLSPEENTSLTTPEPKQSSYLSTIVGDFNESLCSSFGTIKGGYAPIGLQVQAIDAETKESVVIERVSFNFLQGQGGGSSGSVDGLFSCFTIDPRYDFSLGIFTKDYIPTTLLIEPLAIEKMHLITVEIQKKPSCYLSSDAEQLAQYHSSITQGFGLEQEKYMLTCTDADITRGGFITSSGTLSQGGTFKMYYRWGWCSSGGADCGFTKCFSAEGNDEVFVAVKKKMCAEIRSQGYHDETMCTDPAYDDTTKIREDCLAGAYEFVSGDMKTISIVQQGSRCGSTVEKGKEDCLNSK
jgi:hypothetical protein